jgi:predicted deacetylase
MKKCTIRLDDITPNMNWENFFKVKEILDKHDIKPLIGVVPDNKDPKLNIDYSGPEFWGYIKDLQKSGWTIAQHGYQHKYVTTCSGILGINNRSEFAGLKYEEQLEKLKLGRKILEDKGIKSDIFMAPSHSYDKETLKALKVADFKIVTDGYTKYPYKENDLLFIPSKIPMLINFDGIETVCLHTNTITTENIILLDKRLYEFREFMVSYSEMINICNEYNLERKYKLEQKRRIFYIKTKGNVKKIIKKIINI